jgi:putative transposase
MPWKQPVPVKVSGEAQTELQKLIKRPSTPQQIALRARVIELASQGLNNAQIARKLEVHEDLPRKWRRRWQSFEAMPLQELSVLERLEDIPRPGKPSKYTAEQICQITALACERPGEQSPRPISQWSNRELAEEIMRRGIVKFISPRQAARFLKGGRP